MGLLLSVIISYAGIRDAIETIKHILSGILPESDPDFQDLVDYYTRLLQKSANPATTGDWTRECGQGYLSLTEDKNGILKSAAVKYYDGQPDSTAILFSTKISSFGQESVEDSASSQANGDYRSERYIPTKTKTIISNTSESFNIGIRNKSPTPSGNISDPNRISSNSFECDASEAPERIDDAADEKLTWHYRPLSPTPQTQTLPEIHFQSFDDDKRGVYTEDFLRLIFIDIGEHCSSSLALAYPLSSDIGTSPSSVAPIVCHEYQCTSRKLIPISDPLLHLYNIDSCIVNLFKIT